MRSLFVIAMLLLTGVVARAETFSFVIGGQAIHIGIHGRCSDISCVSVNVSGYYSQEGRRSGRSQRHHETRRGKAKPAAAPQDIAMRETPAPKAATVQEVATRSITPATEPAPAPAAELKSATEHAPTDSAAERKVAEPKVAEQKIAAAPAQPGEPAPTAKIESKPEPAMVIAALPPAKPEAEQTSKPAPAMATGTWSGSDGQLRIEPCGQHLCGYAAGGKNAGKMVLINMRQTKANSWAGRVHDFKSGGVYSARMILRGPNSLRVEGCAFGGMICDGRTLARVN